ncbi:MAG: hypothetical protein U5L02_14270 [Rheinheimera sp.]|nr:hypothetical protein [Rheinheimera sp.]
MGRFWQRYQQLLQRSCHWFSPQFLQLCAVLLLLGSVVLFLLPQRSEWLLLPLLLLLWCLLLLLARQMFQQVPAAKPVAGLLARLGYWLRFGWYQLMLLLFLLLCLICLAFSLKLAGVILRAILA